MKNDYHMSLVHELLNHSTYGGTGMKGIVRKMSFGRRRPAPPKENMATATITPDNNIELYVKLQIAGHPIMYHERELKETKFVTIAEKTTIAYFETANSKERFSDFPDESYILRARVDNVKTNLGAHNDYKILIVNAIEDLRIRGIQEPANDVREMFLVDGFLKNNKATHKLKFDDIEHKENGPWYKLRFVKCDEVTVNKLTREYD